MEKYLGVIELENGNYYYIAIRNNDIIAGSAANCGIIPVYCLPYAEDLTIDENIQILYDRILENELY